MADKRGVLMTEDFAKRAGVAVKRLEAEPRFTTGPVGVGSPAFGRPMENWVQLVSTTIAANIATGSQTVMPADMSGIEVGVNLTIGPPGTVEVVAVTAVTDTTFTATFANTHTGPDIVCEGAVTSGYLPGVWSQHDVSDDSWEIQPTAILISTPNGETLEPDTLYRAVAAGEVDGVMVFDAIVPPPGTGGTITVEEADGTPSYTDITKLRFDQADGFVVTNPGAGIARVDFANLTVEDIDSAPSYTGIKTLRFDQADGFTLSNPSAGIARVDFAGVMTVEEADGTPSYTGINTIRFDQADGFTVTNPSAGVARIDLTSGGGTAGGLMAVRVYTANDTWTKPVGLGFVIVEVQGGGGGGGGTSGGGGTGTAAAGGGGSGGGYARKKIAVGGLGATEAVTIGTGGAGGSGGTPTGVGGLDTTFGSHVTGAGGQGGLFSSSGAGGTSVSGIAGVADSDGDINCVGGCGDPGFTSSYLNLAGMSGSGGSSHFGGGGPGLGVSGDGSPGEAFGGGGSGGLTLADGDHDGGAGADGLCVVYEYSA